MTRNQLEKRNETRNQLEKRNEKHTNTWRLNNILLNNEWDFGQDQGIGRYALFTYTTKRRITTNVKTEDN